MRLAAYILATLAFSSSLRAYTKSGTVYTTTGSASDVNAAIINASAGDTVNVPAGTFTWGAAGAYVDLTKAVTLQGAGVGSTIITGGGSPVIQISGAGRVTGFTINGYASGDTIFTCTSTAGWRIDHCSTYAASGAGRSFRIDQNGLIDHCTIDSADVTEHIWTTAIGGDNHTNQDAVWLTPSDMGTADAIFVEDCIFNGNGYVSDFGYASRAVVRFCTMNGTNQIDAHGPESNYRGNRQIEAYGNHWTLTAAYWQALNIRAGSLIAFDNVSDITSNDVWFWIQHYAAQTNVSTDASPAFGYDWHTPSDYPHVDQEGIGRNPGKIGGEDPAYVFHNTQNGAEWPITYGPNGTIGDYTSSTDSAGYSIGATSITIGAFSNPTQCNQLYAGNLVTFAGDTNYYTVAATRAGAGVLTIASPGLLKAIPASATVMTFGPFTKYNHQLGSGGHTFTMQDIIAEDRDLFLLKASFTGASGMGRGTKAAMLAITPTTRGVGYWVTNEGNWNTTLSADTSGQLYTWNGSAWVLRYRPYTYPHPRTKANNVTATAVTVGTLNFTP